jgi:HK97 family phage portal protein
MPSLWTTLRDRLTFQPPGRLGRKDLALSVIDPQQARDDWQWGGYPSTDRNLRTDAGDVRLNAIVMVCLQWIARNFPDAPPVVRKTSVSPPEIVPGHPLVQLLKAPNPFYGGRLLWQPTLFDFVLTGNAYWIKHWNAGGTRPQALYWEPSSNVRPVGTRDVFLTGYELWRDNAWQPLALGQVVHFRDGIDPTDQRRGRSPLAAALGEIFTDNEAAMFTASLLRNVAVPSLLVSPKDSNGSIPDPQQVKDLLVRKTRGDDRGAPLVFEEAMQVDRLSFTPAELDLGALRETPEERVPALLGLNRMALGLGKDPKYSNMKEAREAAYEENLIPLQALLGDVIGAQLLPDLGDPATEECGWDYRLVRVLQPDENALWDRLSRSYDSGWVARADVRRAVGLDTGTWDAVYNVPRGATIIPADTEWLTPDPVIPAGLPGSASAPEGPPGRKAFPAPTDGLPSKAMLEVGLRREVATWLQAQYAAAAAAVPDVEEGA